MRDTHTGNTRKIILNPEILGLTGQYDDTEEDACSPSLCFEEVAINLMDYVYGLGLNPSVERAIKKRLRIATIQFCAGRRNSIVLAYLNSTVDYIRSQSGGSIPAGEAAYLAAQLQRLGIMVDAGIAECCSVVPPEAFAGENGLPMESWLELEAGQSPTLEVFPNPFSDQATVRFFLPKAGTATVEVFNLQGQRIQPLAAGAFEAGSHELPWYGNAEGGKAQESGIYLIRLITREGIQVKRVSFVR